MDADAYIGRCRHGNLSDGCAKCEDAAEALRMSQRPMADEMMRQARSECGDDYVKRGIFISGWIGAEQAHNIKP